MWIQLTHFAIEPTQDDGTLLASLIESAGYAHDYASPFELQDVIAGPAVHGRWWRTGIRPGLFEPWIATTAEAPLHAWADEQEWTEPFRQPPEVRQLLESGSIYKLNNPGQEAEHDCG